MSPTWDETCLIEMFVETLAPFSTLTDKLSMSKSVSITSLYPLLLHIQKVCATPITLPENAPEDMLELSTNIRSAVWKYINDR